jgi:hypothetical protein
MILAGAQAAANMANERGQRTEAAGVSQVQAALRYRGWARGRAADQLRHHGCMTAARCAARGVSHYGGTYIRS